MCCGSVYSGHVCVCTRLDMASARGQGVQGTNEDTEQELVISNGTPLDVPA